MIDWKALIWRIVQCLLGGVALGGAAFGAYKFLG